ncbi:dihydrolipoamide acetyltransferase family protein [Nocardia sp. PE-7]|uniref:dihydrolipoamide acetyltransferase family protein n=1 Tax=Nocardia sp. PE-7 TaxID=3058426 RepID=UPI00265A9702|nr:dihydrolipoamide acetyltransferase family protein [Nocardia sp. PE-7]WKG11905.1 dihydrolipoamide acetyltransferase family protein [Nocardia sp. PE-7]
MPEIVMPRLSDTMEDGVVSAWLKQVGDQITRGEIVAEIETDKALMELEAYDDGVLEKILAEPGVRVPIGEPIAIVGDGTASTAAPADPTSAAVAPSITPAAAPQPGAHAGLRRTGVVKSSPLARKIAREMRVDIDAVVGTGPGGRITRRDVEAAHSAVTAEPADATTSSPETSVTAVQPVPASGEFEEVALTNIQRVSAIRLTESKQQAPHFYLTSAIDVTELFAFRAQINATLDAAGESKVSVNDLLVKAVAVALRKDGAVNVSFAGDKLLRHKGIHLGVAVATPAGLLVPVIRDADRKSVSEIATESRDKATRARDRKLRAEEMSGGTFTISNLGMFGIEQFTAVINSPESAILAVGAAADELRLDGEKVVARKTLRVTLSADHRAIDGAVAAQFLANLKVLLESPLRIVA